jgi:hypothetical protein
MPDDLERAFAFMRLADMLGTHAEPTPYGTAVSTPELPLRQDSNYLLVERTDAPATDLARELERLSLRAIVVRDERTAERLSRELAALGWQAHRHLVMAHRRPPERTADTSIVAEVGEQVLRPLRRRITLSYPWGTPELADQLLRAKAMMAERVETHFLAVVVDGEPVAYADLYIGGGVAQIEDVLHGRGAPQPRLRDRARPARARGGDSPRRHARLPRRGRERLAEAPVRTPRLRRDRPLLEVLHLRALSAPASDCPASSTGANRSPRRSTRSSTTSSVSCDGSSSSLTSSQERGVETGAPGRGRTE